MMVVAHITVFFITVLANHMAWMRILMALFAFLWFFAIHANRVAWVHAHGWHGWLAVLILHLMALSALLRFRTIIANIPAWMSVFAHLTVFLFTVLANHMAWMRILMALFAFLW